MASVGGGGGGTKVSWRLRELEAHGGAVTCAALSRGSGRLLATGGADCRVNLWAVSKDSCIMSLTGHKSPVECVQLNPSEEQVAAGSQSGSIRVWDLEAAKLLKTLMGHKANVSCLSFHPFGNFLASGSSDTNIKLWDIRKKGYVLSFKDHSRPVRSLAFSPDGKWLASAGDDGSVKLWDLSQGKKITEFTSHSAAVSIVQFHPNEYLLASGSADRTVRLWDLERFSQVGSLEGHTSSVRCILFSPDGSCLFSGASDCLRVFGWEPDRCFDVVPVGWGRVADLSLTGQQLVAVSHQLSTVSTYVVDLKRVKRSGESKVPGSVQDDRPLAERQEPRGAALRRSYERPTPTCSSQRESRRSEAERRSPEGERRSLSEEETEEKVSTAEIHNAEDYQEIFQPRRAISRTPPRTSEPFPAPPEDAVLPFSRHMKDLIPAFPDKLQVKPPPSPPVQRVKPTVVSSSSSSSSSSKPPAALAPPPSQAPPPSRSRPVELIPSNRSAPIGLNVADFLPASGCPASLSDEDALALMKKGHDTMCVMLSSRLKNLETVRAVWTREDIKSAVDTAVSMNDLSIVVDVLNIINLQPSLWKLDLVTTVLPQIDKLLQSKYESYMHSGCSSLRLVMKHFWPLISDTLKATPSVGVDISREERLLKCQLCLKQLRNLRQVVKNKAELVGRHGSTFCELQLLTAPLDDLL
ncbi:katanin p80 WD40 repeat-containing subunit B1 isoform X2 [Salarias fasciatus]|uniref:katanin p80 WD40 repeat-containing subunit B1 isoform X2 n=1 Tax=Salarias fasciatus TaxID=181472 RepID=UPI001176997D|nr:katanin p80 WD40 repeat-containing subunit B1 isoform X2 [Salarias fasciatus]